MVLTQPHPNRRIICTNRSGSMSAKEKRKTVFRDNQDLVEGENVTEDNIRDRDNLGPLNSEEIRFEHADDIYDINRD